MRMTSKHLSVLLCLCVALSGCEGKPTDRAANGLQPSPPATTAMDDATMEKIAEQFFLNLVEEKGEDAFQGLEMIDEMRSWIRDRAITDLKIALQPYGGVGEFQKKEIVRHGTQTKSVELFYSGETSPFKARVTFTENQISGIHLFPWADE